MDEALTPAHEELERAVAGVTDQMIEQAERAIFELTDPLRDSGDE